MLGSTKTRSRSGSSSTSTIGAVPPLPRFLNGTFGRLFVDVRHLPGVERFQDGGGALGAERYADAVVPSGVDPGGDALLVVDEYLDDALVDEDAQA